MIKLSPKIIEVNVLQDYKLLLKFETDEQKIFDVKPYLQYDVFKPINNYEEFKNVYIDYGTVCWKCGADLSRDTVYLKSYLYDAAIEM